MKDDLIKRSDAIKDLCDISNNSDMPEDWHRGLSVAISALYRVPSADRPQGEWKDVPPNAWRFNDIVQWHECSACKGRSMFISNYCPHCGAYMWKGADDYERAIEQMEHDMLYEPTYNSKDGSM